jgi:tetratricopeptide (TPR) repeat protein
LQAQHRDSKSAESAAAEPVLEANLERFLEQVKAHPLCAQAHYKLGETLYELRENTEAVESLGRAIHLKPDYADAYFFLARCYYELGNRSEEVEAFKQAIRFDSDNADPCKR